MSEKRHKQYRKVVYDFKLDLIRKGYRGGKLDRAARVAFPRCLRHRVVRILAGRDAAPVENINQL